MKRPTISLAGLIPKDRVSIEPGRSMVRKALLPLWADANGVSKDAVIKVMAKIAKSKVDVLFIFVTPFFLPCAGQSARLMSEGLLRNAVRRRRVGARSRRVTCVAPASRSEERRVGKECGCRGSPE